MPQSKSHRYRYEKSGYFGNWGDETRHNCKTQRQYKFLTNPKTKDGVDKSMPGLRACFENGDKRRPILNPLLPTPNQKQNKTTVKTQR